MQQPTYIAFCNNLHFTSAKNTATVILAFAILLASGFFFEGYSSGMTITGVFNISKIILKIYSFVESIQKWLDKLFELIIKGEYKILGIKVKGEGEE